MRLLNSSEQGLELSLGTSVDHPGGSDMQRMKGLRDGSGSLGFIRAAEEVGQGRELASFLQRHCLGTRRLSFRQLGMEW